MCKHRFGVKLLQNPPLCSSTAPFYSGPTAPIMNFQIVAENLAQGQGDPPSIEVPLHPLWICTHCPETVTQGPGDPLSIEVPLRPFMNFHIVAETVAQGQGDPPSIEVPLHPLWIFTLSQKLWPKDKQTHFYSGPTAPIMNFHFVTETVTQGQGDPPSIEVPLHPLWIFTLSQKLWPKDKQTHFYSGPTAPIMNFHFVTETVTQGQGDPPSRGPFLDPFGIFTLSRLCWHKDKETNW